MKKWIFMLLLAGSIQGVYAQKTEKKDKFNPNTPLFEELTDVKKKTDKFNLYLNMQGSFDAPHRSQRKYQQLAFLPLSPTPQPLERRKRHD